MKYFIQLLHIVLLLSTASTFSANSTSVWGANSWSHRVPLNGRSKCDEIRSNESNVTDEKCNRIGDRVDPIDCCLCIYGMSQQARFAGKKACCHTLAKTGAGIAGCTLLAGASGAGAGGPSAGMACIVGAAGAATAGCCISWCSGVKTAYATEVAHKNSKKNE